MPRLGSLGRLLAVAIFAVTPLLSGCGGKLIPKDLKDFLSAELKTERRNIDVTQPFRTTIIYRIPNSTRATARDFETALVSKVIEFGRQQGVKDFLNDSVMFLVRLESSPDINMKWTASQSDLLQVIDSQMTDYDFMERCTKEENWPEELG